MSGVRLLLCTALLLLAPAGAHGAAIYVNTSDDVVGDDGVCSLREAVTAANENDPSGASAGECAAGDPTAMDVIVLEEKTHTPWRSEADAKGCTHRPGAPEDGGAALD
jgi:CSLREA domain-containing protein